MAKNKKQNDNGTQKDGLHLKSTPKGFRVPQYFPRGITGRYRHRSRSGRPHRSSSNGKIGKAFAFLLAIPLALLIWGGMTIIDTYFWRYHHGKDVPTELNATSVKDMMVDHYGLRQHDDDSQYVEQAETIQKASSKKKPKKKSQEDIHPVTEDEQKTSSEDVEVTQHEGEEEDSVLFEQLFNKKVNVHEQSSKTRTSSSRRSNVPSNFVPSASWSPGNLASHWAKHSSEFPEYRNAAEYGNGALYFFERPPPGTLFKSRGNGDRLYYHPASNTFGVTTSNGTPKTMFRPDRGMDYWNRQ